MGFVDTHCHLNLDVFQDNLRQVVERAHDAGINKILVPGIDINTSITAVELASKFDGVYAAVGMHPNEAELFEDHQIKAYEGLLKELKVVAIGEIGLDFYHHPETEPQQSKLLEAMLSLATQYSKPVILHSRNSLSALLKIIEKWIVAKPQTDKKFLGVFHGYEGNAIQAKQIQSLKMAIGIGGPITFKNAYEKQLLVTQLGLKNLVLETDAPFLSPHPFRGQTNEPYRIPLIAEKIADLLQVSVEQVSDVTSQNAQFLFRWDEIN